MTATAKRKRRATAKDGKSDQPKRAAKPKAAAKPKGKAKAKRATRKSPAVEKTARAAAAAGAKGPRLPAARQRLRDTLIVQRAAQDWPNAVIAQEAGVTIRTVERVLRDAKGVPSPLDLDPLRVIDDLVRGLQLSIGDYEAMAAAYVDRHPSAAVGAKKAADDARGRVAAILQALGHVPDDLRRLRVPLEAAQVSTAMVDAVDGFERAVAGLPLDDEAKAAVFDAAGKLRAAFSEFIGEEVDGEVVGELPAGAPA